MTQLLFETEVTKHFQLLESSKEKFTKFHITTIWAKFYEQISTINPDIMDDLIALFPLLELNETINKVAGISGIKYEDTNNDVLEFLVDL